VCHVGSSVHAFHKPRHSCTKRLGGSKKAQDARIADAAFEAADVGWIKVCEFAEFLLSETAFLPAIPEIAPEGRK